MLLTIMLFVWFDPLRHFGIISTGVRHPSLTLNAISLSITTIMRFSSCAACFPRSLPRLVASPLRASVQPRRTYATTTRSQLLKPTTLVLIFVPILTGFLGVWQIRRLKWKVALIEEVDRNLAREPMILPGTIKCVSSWCWY